MRKYQRGVTLIGWLFLLLPLALVVYAGIRVAPIYLNYYRVVQALSQTASESRGSAQVDPAAIRSTLTKRFDVNYIDHPEAKDIDIHRDGDRWVAVADYEDLAPMFGNVSILMQFKKQVDLQ